MNALLKSEAAGLAPKRTWQRGLALISIPLLSGVILAELFSRVRTRDRPLAVVETSAAWDKVDESSWESFPASDSPAWRS